jgi:dCTP deaminase
MYNFGRDKRVESSGHILEPGVRYLGETEESVRLPNDVAAQLAGRSSIGRLGVIVHKTAGWVDPGFQGSITLELMNLGDEPVHLEAGERVAQLVFFKLDERSSGYDGNYQNQSGATKSQK